MITPGNAGQDAGDGGKMIATMGKAAHQAMLVKRER